MCLFLYDGDAMRVPTRCTSHQLSARANKLIRCNLMYLICTLCAKKGPNRVSGAPRGIEGDSSEESDLMLEYGQQISGRHPSECISAK